MFVKNKIDLNVIYQHVKNHDLNDKGVKKQLDEKFDIKQRNPCNGDTILHLACRNGDLKLTQELIEYFKFNPETSNNDGKRPLHEAVQFSNSNCVEYLICKIHVSIDSLKRADWTPLMLACTKPHVEIVKILIDNGANIHAKNKDGWTAFHIAVRLGNMSIVKLLVDTDKSVFNTYSKNGRSIWHTACLHGHIHIINYFFEHFQLINNLQDSCGITPLMDSTKIGNLSLIKALISAGEDVYMVDKLGKNVLHIASEVNQPCVLEYFIKQMNFDINCKTNSKSTPLHIACKEDHLEIVKILVNLKAVRDSKNINGRTPYDIACIVKATHCIQFLNSI